MKLELKLGDEITVKFADTDGEITVKFGETEITVHADMPDTSGREGIIYADKFDRQYWNANNV